MLLRERGSNARSTLPASTHAMGANAINLQELEAELSRTRAAFGAWSAGVLSSAQECKASHLATMRAYKGELASLNERYQRAEKQAAAVRQQMEQDASQEQALHEVADALATEQQTLLKRLQQLQSDLAEDTAAVQQLEAAVEQRRSDAQLRSEKLQLLHDAYRDALGLSLRSQDGELLWEFTQIDVRQPGRTFGFALRIDGDNTYTVTRCEPELECRTQLEAALLRGGSTDLPGFVAAMRRQFQALLAAGAA